MARSGEIARVGNEETNRGCYGIVVLSPRLKDATIFNVLERATLMLLHQLLVASFAALSLRLCGQQIHFIVNFPIAPPLPAAHPTASRRALRTKLKVSKPGPTTRCQVAPSSTE